MTSSSPRVNFAKPNIPVAFGTPEFYIQKLEVEMGIGAGIPFSELLARLSRIWSDEERQLVKTQIESHASTVTNPKASPDSSNPFWRRLSDQQEGQLASVLIELVKAAKTLAPKDRIQADRAVSRLSKLLSPELAWKVVSPWLSDTQTFRTAAVTRTLHAYRVPSTLVGTVVQRFRSSPDRLWLKLLSAAPEAASEISETAIEPILEIMPDDWIHETQVVIAGEPLVIVHRDSDTRYWRMRAIELLIIGGKVPSREIALRFPMEFVWAVGRQAYRPGVPLLMQLVIDNSTDPELLWRSIRALKRAGTDAELDHLYSLARDFLDIHGPRH